MPETPEMVSISNHPSHMLARNMNVADEEYDFPLFPETSNAVPSLDSYTMNPPQAFDADVGAFTYALSQNPFEAVQDFATIPTYTEPSHLAINRHSPSVFPTNSPELHAPTSSMSTASGRSAASSIMGSPYSGQGHNVPAVPDWVPHDFGPLPSIVGYDIGAQEYDFAGMDMDFAYTNMNKPGFVDPSLIHGYQAPALDASMDNSSAYQQASMYPAPTSPTLSQRSYHSTHSPAPNKQGTPSPYQTLYQYPPPEARPSPPSHPSSCISISSPSSDSPVKGACPHADCGKVFKDLKAHMLTHQNERPEKCPINSCDYHIKGFARKYDKNRHTLTHYKGTMVCGFCPGSGSAAEKSFNRADVFKRHLTSVHAVEQTPPNSRKKTGNSSVMGKRGLIGYASDATGKCSTCSATFQNAQDFYEHLDDCVLRIVQQEEPSEAVNAKHLAEVEDHPAVHETLRIKNLPTTTVKNSYDNDDDDDDDEGDDVDYDDYKTSRSSVRRGAATKQSRTSSSGAVQKVRAGLTFSKGGVTLPKRKARKHRREYPSSWGCPTAQMKMKKRVMCAFDGSRRLWKDDMMLSTDYEVRLPLSNSNKYVTDLDMQTMKRAEAFHNATEEEKGPNFFDGGDGLDLEKLMEIKQEM